MSQTMTSNKSGNFVMALALTALAFVVSWASAFQPSLSSKKQRLLSLSILVRDVEDSLDIRRLEPSSQKNSRNYLNSQKSAYDNHSTRKQLGRAQNQGILPRPSQRTSSWNDFRGLVSSEDDLTEELKRLVSVSADAAIANNQKQDRGRNTPSLSTKTPRKPEITKRSSMSTAIKDPVVSPIVDNSQMRRTKQADGIEYYHGNESGGSDSQDQNIFPGTAKDLQRYYRTELLTSEEEFVLGAHIQFMIACDEVHEGLAVRLERLPTLGEWAAACGYNVLDGTFKATEADQNLRPAGCEEMFSEIDPRMFVGNGKVGDAGPGRGRGREKKIPSARLKDRRADSLVPPEMRKRERDPQPVNRGTTRDFLNMILKGREAKQQMVQSNMRLVVSIARKYMNVGVSLHDLVQEGSLGLSRAAEKFDPRKGFKFSTYASWWIQQAVFRSIAYQSRTIRLPVHIHNMLNRIHRVRNLLTKQYGRAPTNEDMASHLGMSLQKYNKLLRLTKRSISLDIPKYKSNPKDLGHEGDDMLGDTIDASSVSPVLLDDSAPDKLVDHTLFLDDLKGMLQILEKEERLVLCARYGLSDGITRTVTSVAAEMKQSKAWVRSQECRALRKLRRPWYEKKLKEHESSLVN